MSFLTNGSAAFKWKLIWKLHCHWLMVLQQRQMEVAVWRPDSWIHVFTSVQHDVPNVDQTVWTSAYLTSVPGQYKWPSGEVVLYGLASSIQGRARLYFGATAKMSDGAGTGDRGFFCEREGMYWHVGISALSVNYIHQRQTRIMEFRYMLYMFDNPHTHTHMYMVNHRNNDNQYFRITWKHIAMTTMKLTNL